MPLFYPSYQSLRLADQILEEIAGRVPGYQGRIGACWYWRLTGGVLVTFEMGFTVTEQRWDVLRAVAVTPSVGQFSAAEFPFAAYGTLVTSPPFIHDLEGEAEWANRLYFQMGKLISDAVMWLEMLLAAVIDPQVHPPSAFPTLNSVERELVAYAVDVLQGYFTLSKLRKAFAGRLSARTLTRLAHYWEAIGLLTEKPRRVTVALRALAGDW